MALNKRLIVAGLLCSISTQLQLYSDDTTPVNSSVLAEVAESPSQTPPVLFAPNPNAKPVQPPSQNRQEVQPTVKLTPEPKTDSTPKLAPTQPILVVLPTPAPHDSDFVSLLSGTGLDGWTVHEGRQDAWQRDGEAVYCQGSGGGWLRTEKQYSDFHLKLEYKLQTGANSGIGIRSPELGNPTFAGIELQLLDDSSPKYANVREDQHTGSLYYHVAPSQQPKLHPVGEWNQCEVICKGDQITIKLNGETVNDTNVLNPTADKSSSTGAKSQLAKRPPIGRIALQSSNSRVDFRNIQLKDLSVETSSGVKYVDLQAGDGALLTNATTLQVHYVGQLLNGTRFGDTRDLGEPVTVPLEGVIEGWKHGMTGMKVGGRRRLIVPPEMAYGSQGVKNLIPPGATLVFEVELCGFAN